MPARDLLVNGSFEGTYRAQGGSNILVAEHWRPFWRQDEPAEDGPQDSDHWAQQPEYKPVGRNLPGPPRVLTGETAQCWFVRYKVMDGGIFQVVETPYVGRLAVFSVFGHCWCSESDDPAAVDGEFYMQVGVDTAGGSDWKAPGVLWGTWKRLVGIYEPLSASFEIKGLRTTVFVRAWNKYRVSHADGYVDDAALTVDVDGGGPGPGAEVDYDRIRRIVREEIDKTRLIGPA